MIDSIMQRRFFRSALAALALVVLADAPAVAQDLFEVTGIEVDESASDEVQAKLTAIAKAQREALQVVMRRLVQPEDYDRLPQVDGERLSLMVRDYDIADEKFGGGRYLATISVRFLPEEVANTLRDVQIPFAMTRSRPLVVLPVIDTGSARRLWDDPNPWRTAWESRMPHPGLFSLVMPAGDLSDVATVNVNQALSADPAAINAIANKYDAAGAMIAIASVSGNEGRRAVTVTLHFIGGNKDGTSIEQRYAGSGEIIQFLSQVVADILGDLEREWKQSNLLDFSRVERVSVLVPLQGLDTWLTVRERLEGMSRVQSISVARMSREEIELDLVYVGSTDQLQAALQQHGLELVYSPDHPLWLLRQTGGR